MKPVTAHTAQAALVQHVVTCEFGIFQRLDHKGRAVVLFNGCTQDMPVPRHLIAEVEVVW